jgi:hypothetical protein
VSGEGGGRTHTVIDLCDPKTCAQNSSGNSPSSNDHYNITGKLEIVNLFIESGHSLTIKTCILDRYDRFLKPFSEGDDAFTNFGIIKFLKLLLGTDKSIGL